MTDLECLEGIIAVIDGDYSGRRDAAIDHLRRMAVVMREDEMRKKRAELIDEITSDLNQFHGFVIPRSTLGFMSEYIADNYTKKEK